MYALYLLIRIVLYPFLRFLLPLLSREAKERVIFELKDINQGNRIDSADYAFEVSSEGELEQVRVVIQKILDQGERVEIIFCSESVTSQCLALREKYPKQVRILQLPILCFHPFSVRFNSAHWLTAQKLYLCRYDFFPELIFYGHRRKHFVLLSGAEFDEIGNKKRKSLYKQVCYRRFDLIVTANPNSKKVLETLYKINSNKIMTYDFRIMQIIERLNVPVKTWSRKLGTANALTDYITSIDSNNKCILGSFWEEEVSLLQQAGESPMQYFVFPHKLGKAHLESLTQKLSQAELNYLFVNDNITTEELKNQFEQAKQQSFVWVVTTKGILCESYSLFDKAYVGGGFGRSVHSLLEAYLANCLVFCGPATHRSTEYDLIKSSSPTRITQSSSMSEMGKLLVDHHAVQESLESFLHKYVAGLEISLTKILKEES